MQALVAEGINPDEHLFEIDTKVPAMAKPQRGSGGGVKATSDDDNKAQLARDDEDEDKPDKNGTDDAADGGNGVAEAAAADTITAGDTGDSAEVPPPEETTGNADATDGSEKLQLDNSNVDNEDSLNLTIGEDEANIFQDEVSELSEIGPKPNMNRGVGFFLHRFQVH